MYRFTRNLTSTISNCGQKQGQVDINEVQRVEVVWLKQLQQPFYNTNNFKELKLSLGIYIDENDLLPFKGSLNKAALPVSSKNPILLPKAGHLVNLIIQDVHIKTGHGDVKDTLTETRSKFWILQGQQVVKSFCKKCVYCNKYESEPFPKQISNDLPNSCVQSSFAFQSTGVDYLGIVLVKP